MSMVPSTRRSSTMQSAPGQSEHGFTESLRERGVRLDETRNAIRDGFRIHRQVTLAEHFGDPRADQVDAKNRTGAAVGLALRHDLHQSFDVADDAGPTVATQRVLLDCDIETALPRRGLGQPCVSHLWVAIDAPRDAGIVDRYDRLPQDAPDGQYPFRKSDMGQLRRVDYIAHSPDTVSGRRPTATTTASTVTVSLSKYTVVIEPVGRCSLTRTPVCTAMPRFRNERASHATISRSHSGRIVSMASSTVTCTPRSLNMEANSHPITPPPMIAAEAGSASRASTSSEVSTRLPSTSNPGRLRATDPGASMT